MLSHHASTQGLAVGFNRLLRSEHTHTDQTPKKNTSLGQGYINHLLPRMKTENKQSSTVERSTQFSKKDSMGSCGLMKLRDANEILGERAA